MVSLNKIDGQFITNNVEYYGLSTDEKPITNIPNGSVFFAMDTQQLYLFDLENQTWIEQ